MIDHVTIVFNPNSTNDSEANARHLADTLQAKQVQVDVVPTTHAGHALQLAEEFASAHPQGMIVSSSGDGGYHELVNGIMNSGIDTVTTGVLPSGNANDHFHFVHRGEVPDRVVADDADMIDLLKVSTPAWTHYAHSYVGLGMTPQIGKALTEATLNPLTEAWLVIKHLFMLKSVSVTYDGVRARYSHIVCSNSGRMSKYLTMSTDASIDDGRFELTMVKASSPWALMAHIGEAAAGATTDTPQVTKVTFVVHTKTTIQLDGEVYPIARGDTVTVECIPRVLRCIV